jgi:hypothetical protein
VGVREEALSFEDGFHISWVGRELLVLDQGRGSQSSGDTRVGGESLGMGSAGMSNGLRISDRVGDEIKQEKPRIALRTVFSSGLWGER